MHPEEEEAKRKAAARSVIEVSESVRMMVRNRRQRERKQGATRCTESQLMVTSEKAPVNILLGAGRYYYNATLDINAFTTRCVVITRPLHRSPVALTLSAPPPTPTLQSLLPLPKTTSNTSDYLLSRPNQEVPRVRNAVSVSLLRPRGTPVCPCFTVHS